MDRHRRELEPLRDGAPPRSAAHTADVEADRFAAESARVAVAGGPVAPQALRSIQRTAGNLAAARLVARDRGDGVRRVRRLLRRRPITGLGEAGPSGLPAIQLLPVFPGPSVQRACSLPAEPEVATAGPSGGGIAAIAALAPAATGQALEGAVEPGAEPGASAEVEAEEAAGAEVAGAGPQAATAEDVSAASASAGPLTETPGAAESTAAETAPPPAGPRPMLRRGSTGPAVEELQAKLNGRGADPALVVDGIFGPLTRAAVVGFQAGEGLVPDGIVGPLTWGALDAEAPGPEPEVDPLEGLPVTVEGHGSSAEAVTAARSSMAELFGGLTPASRAQLLTTSIVCDVIPHDKKLTELAPYQHLAGTNTFDGRLWDDVRGIQTIVDDVRRVAVAEEDLVSVPGVSASYGSGFLAAHEGGHGVQFTSLTAAQLTTLTTIHQARLAATGPITQATPVGPATAQWLPPAWYSAANKEEYFANSVAAWWGHPYTDSEADQAVYTRAWLAANDPAMHTLLTSVFATP